MMDQQYTVKLYCDRLGVEVEEVVNLPDHLETTPVMDKLVAMVMTIAEEQHTGQCGTKHDPCISEASCLELVKTLDQYEHEIASHKCSWCGGALTMRYHPHSGGVLVTHQGRTTRQWVYAQCQQCEYQWALWKLRRNDQLTIPIEQSIVMS